MTNRNVSAWLSLGFLATLGLLVGCGKDGDGPQRYRASGNVSLDGQPVSKGTIYFAPASGNKGPQGFSAITNGNYDTQGADGSGTVGGPHRVKIIGPDFEYQGKVDVDLPKADGSQNFELKANEVKKIAPSAPA
ncbi:hypothetical protein NA78x_000746 [Anatilimnocola sp. NA78]|uniref:hypothetical protein n=1 Tax=Anatilimnocola sp. NA78 TaxID=3415683 RepID=UPI003CE4D85B